MKTRFKPKIDINWRKVVRISLWSLLICAFAMSVGFTTYRHHYMPCKSYDINISDSGSSFVDYNDIDQIIKDKFGGLKGRSMNEINIELLEKIIRNNPFVSNAEVFSTLDGIVKIEVAQRKPILRVFNYNDESFYIDNTGKFMPTSPKFTANVPVANGVIVSRETDSIPSAEGLTKHSAMNDSLFHPSLMQGLYIIAKFIYCDYFWSGQVEQLYANEDGDIELISRVGNHRIIFGDATRVKEKFDKLFLLYTKGFDKTGWNNYNIVNLKYNNQVVCTKK
jgi:cell division protein FtsQ